MSANHRPGAQQKKTPAVTRQWTDAAVALRWSKKLESDARTKKLELEYAEAAGVVWRDADLKPYFGGVWGGLRTKLMELPQVLGDRLNPTDPVAASMILDEELRRILESTCEQLTSYVPPKRKRRPGKVGKAPRVDAQPPDAAAKDHGDGVGG